MRSEEKLEFFNKYSIRSLQLGAILSEVRTDMCLACFSFTSFPLHFHFFLVSHYCVFLSKLTLLVSQYTITARASSVSKCVRACLESNAFSA